MSGIQLSSVYHRGLKEDVLRECRPDWPVDDVGTSLETAVDLLFDCALELPIAQEVDFAASFRQKLLNYFEAAGPETFAALVRLFEPYLKGLLEICDEDRFKALHQPPPDWDKPQYNPTLSDLCGEKGFDFWKAPRRIQEASRRVRELRNKVAHDLPALSQRQVVQGLVDLLLCMLWATNKYAREMQSILFVRPRGDHLEGMQRQWEENLRRWVLLEAGEIRQETPLNLTAGEVAWDGSDKKWREDAERENLKSPLDDGEEIDGGSDGRSGAMRQGPVHGLFREVRRLILIASAGAGKTTTLQHFAYLEAAELLKDDRCFRPLPLYVPLRNCRGDLWADLSRASNSGPNDFLEEVREGKWFLLLDGLNEVRADQYENVLRQLEELIRDYREAPIVITSRPDSALHRLPLPVFRLDLLSNEKIEQFIRGHFADIQDAAAFTRALRNHRVFWEWARNPLQLWMLTQVGLKVLGGLPKNRGQLLRNFIRAILRREMSKSQQTNERVKLDLLGELGFTTRSDGRLAFPWLLACQVVRDRCQQMGYQLDSAKFLQELCDNNLLSEQADQLTFAHEMYQEYFAALGLKWRYDKDPEVVDLLLDQQRWEEPIILLYGLLESPQSLLERIIQRRVDLAAACVTSELAPQQEKLVAIRQQIDDLDVRAASDEQLARALRAIYQIGDGKLLAEHLLFRQKANRLRGIGQQVAMAFTGEESAIEATLASLEHLAGNAKAFVQVLLNPFRGRPISVAREHGQRAEKLARDWQEQGFSPGGEIRLRAAFGLINQSAVEALINRLRVSKKVPDALAAIAEWGLQAAFPVKSLIEQLVRQGRVSEALDAIRKFRLEANQFSREASIVIGDWIKQGRLSEALDAIRKFGLEADFPPGPLIEELMSRGQWSEAWDAIDRFGEEAVYPPGPLIQEPISRRPLSEALDAIRKVGLEVDFPPGPLIRELIRRRQLSEALDAIGKCGLEADFPPGPLIQELIRRRELCEALDAIHKFGLEVDFPPGPLIQELIRRRELCKALDAIHKFGLKADLPPDPLIVELICGRSCDLPKACTSIADGKLICHRIDGRWVQQVVFAEAAIRMFGLEPNQFSQEASTVIGDWIKQGRLSDALLAIRRFGLETVYPPGPLIQELIRRRQLCKALDAIHEFELEADFPPGPLIQELIRRRQLCKALDAIHKFGLEAELPPGPLIRELIRRRQLSKALDAIHKFGLEAELPPGPLIRELIRRRQLSAALYAIGKFGLEGDFSPGPLIQELILRGELSAAVGGIQDFGLELNQFSLEASTVIGDWIKQGQLSEALDAIREFGLELNQFSQEASIVIGDWIKQGRLCKALDAICKFGLELNQFSQEASIVIGDWIKQGRLREALDAICKFGLEADFPPGSLIQELIRRRELSEALDAICKFRLGADFPPSPLVQELICLRQFSEAVAAIYKFGLEADFPTGPLIQEVINCGQLSPALHAIRKHGLEADFPPEPLIQELIRRGELFAAMHAVKMLPLQPNQFSEEASIVIGDWIKQGRVSEALHAIIIFGLDGDFPPEPLIQELIRRGELSEALVTILYLGLERDFPPGPLIQEFMRRGELSEALNVIFFSEQEGNFPPGPLIQELVRRGELSEALDAISKFGLEADFPPEPLIQELIRRGELSEALDAISKFGLEADFPPEPLIQELIRRGELSEALDAISKFGLEADFPPGPLIQELIRRRELSAALDATRKFGIRPSQFGQIARNAIAGLVANGKLSKALKAAQAFELNMEQFAETALTHFQNRVLHESPLPDDKVIVAFGVEKRLGEWLASRVHHGQIDEDKLALAPHMLSTAPNALRTWIVRVLLETFADVDCAFRLLNQVGFCREHLEHNCQCIKRVRQIQEDLQRAENIAGTETFLDVRLYGRLLDDSSVFAPGMDDFRVSDKRPSTILVGQIVSFGLVVERHPIKGHLVLNAIDLRPQYSKG